MRNSTHKTARLELRCTALELEKWRCLAKQYGMSLSALIRVLLNKSESQVNTERHTIDTKMSRSESRLSPKRVLIESQVSRNESMLSIKRAINEAQVRHTKVSLHGRHQAVPLLIRQVSAIGNNLNQIAYWVNTHKSQAEVRLVEREIARIRKVLEALLVQQGTSGKRRKKQGEKANDNAGESV